MEAGQHHAPVEREHARDCSGFRACAGLVADVGDAAIANHDSIRVRMCGVEGDDRGVGEDDGLGGSTLRMARGQAEREHRGEELLAA